MGQDSDLKAIFDKHGIAWRDHGKNVAGNNIVTACPWCNSSSNPDPGEHLEISLIGEYYCFRNSKHAGHNLSVLFSKLKIPKSAYAHLKLDENIQRTYVPDEKDYSLWRFFKPAWEDKEALFYLESRLFERPEETAHKFNLRVDPEGKWSGRLLIPLSIGWTGRAMREHIEPRYKAYTSEDGFYSFSYSSSSSIIVEGALDAMRIASVSTQFDVAGKCRIELSSALIKYLRDRRYLSIYSAPDATVLYTQAREELNLLKNYCTWARVSRVYTPEGFKDFGACPETITRKLLGGVGYDRNGELLRQSI